MPNSSKKPKKLDREALTRVTSAVPVERAFHFFADFRKPLGIYASSIFDFAEKLKKVDLQSLEFHLKRNDFSNWLNEVIHDEWLANEFEKVRNLPASGEKLRTQLVTVTEKRCKELMQALKDITT
ncbi:MAG TPA: DUF5752 family protein [Candidatus Acidoferrales bacterium]|nr:DUF5752 family protein [Candidatus Acidoferrales bacterium]